MSVNVNTALNGGLFPSILLDIRIPRAMPSFSIKEITAPAEGRLGSIVDE